MNFIYLSDNLVCITLQLGLVPLHLGERVLDPVYPALDLVVNSRYFSFQDITVRVLAGIADLLITVSAGVYISFF